MQFMHSPKRFETQYAVHDYGLFVSSFPFNVRLNFAQLFHKDSFIIEYRSSWHHKDVVAFPWYVSIGAGNASMISWLTMCGWRSLETWLLATNHCYSTLFVFTSGTKVTNKRFRNWSTASVTGGGWSALMKKRRECTPKIIFFCPIKFPHNSKCDYSNIC